MSYSEPDYDYYIARTDVSSGITNLNWASTVVYPTYTKGIVYNSSYILVYKTNWDNAIYEILAYDHSGSYVKTIETIYNGSCIACDDTNCYIAEDGEIAIYNIATGVRTEFTVDLEEGGTDSIHAIAVNNSIIFVVTDTKVKRYDTAGTKLGEFTVTGNIIDIAI